MSTTDDGGPAFPRVCPEDSEHTAWDTPGMTLRDYFAGQAIGAFLRMQPPEFGEGQSPTALLAEYCYGVADAMLAERAKPK